MKYDLQDLNIAKVLIVISLSNIIIDEEEK